MLESNVFILSERYTKLEQAFLNDPRIGSVHGSNVVPFRISDTVDILLIDGQRMLSSAQKLISSIRLYAAVFPRILFLNEHRCNENFLQNVSVSADRICCHDISPEELVDSAVSLWSTPFPILADIDGRHAAACAILNEMKMPESLLGYKCIAIGAALLSCTYRRDIPLKFWLYVHIATEMSSKPALVERNIRTAIENMFLNGDILSIQKYFGYTCDSEKGKPTNAEMLYLIAEHIKQKFTTPEY